MKKFISITAILAAVCMLGGCGTSKDKAAEATTEAKETIVPIELKASDYVELGQYKGLTIEGASVTVTDDEVNDEVANLANDYTEYVAVKNRDTVKEDDYVNIDYICTIDGKESADYTDSDIDIQIGAGDFNLGEGFDVESELVGAKVGETKTLNLTFPEDYDDDAVAGKACEMEVTVNAIEKEKVPEITDAFIKENTDCSTLKEYKKQVREELEEEYASEAEQTNQSTLWDMILKSSTQKKDFPEDVVAQEVSNLSIENEEWASYFGMDVEEFIQEYYGSSLEEYAKSELKRQCVQDLLVEKEGIEVTDQEFDDEIETYINEYGYETKEDILESFSEDDIRSQILYTKLMTTLMADTTVTKDGTVEESDTAGTKDAAENAGTEDTTENAEAGTADVAE